MAGISCFEGLLCGYKENEEYSSIVLGVEDIAQVVEIHIPRKDPKKRNGFGVGSIRKGCCSNKTAWMSIIRLYLYCIVEEIFDLGIFSDEEIRVMRWGLIAVMMEYEDHLRSVAAVWLDLSMGLDLVMIWLFDSRISLSRLLS